MPQMTNRDVTPDVPMTEPIATYSEVRFDGARTFTLYADKIVVQGRQTLQSDFEATIPLIVLDPNFDRMRIRNQSPFMIGISMAAISFVTCTVLVTGLKMTFADLAPGLVLTMGVVGILLSAATWKKVEFFSFKNHAGVLVLNIARSGKQVGSFEPFVNLLTRQIVAASSAISSTEEKKCAHPPSTEGSSL